MTASLAIIRAVLRGVATMTATTKVAAAVLCLQACVSPILSLPMQVTVNQRAVECLYDKVEKE